VNRDTTGVKSRTFIVAGFLLLVMALTSCGNEARFEEPASQQGIAVSDALERGSAVPVLVKGWIWILSGQPRFCSTLDRAFTPPSCAGRQLAIAGLSVAQTGELADPRAMNSVVWFEEPTSLYGTVKRADAVRGSIDGVITLVDTPSPTPNP
jgi:hypothetical protein